MTKVFIERNSEWLNPISVPHVCETTQTEHFRHLEGLDSAHVILISTIDNTGQAD